MWSLKSPWEVLKKWLQLFLWTLLEFSLIFTVPNLLICQKKICESVPADSTLIYDWKLELSWDVHFFIRTPLRMTGIQTLKFLLAPFKKGFLSFFVCPFEKFSKGSKFHQTEKPKSPYLETHHPQGGRIKIEHSTGRGLSLSKNCSLTPNNPSSTNLSFQRIISHRRNLGLVWNKKCLRFFEIGQSINNIYDVGFH